MARLNRKGEFILHGRRARIEHLLGLIADRIGLEPLGTPAVPIIDARGGPQQVQARCKRCDGRGQRCYRGFLASGVTLTIGCERCDGQGYLIYRPRRGRAWRRS